jgi:hypothetical protein
MKISALPDYLMPGALPGGSSNEIKLLYRLRQVTGQVAGGLEPLTDLVEAWDALPKKEKTKSSKCLGIDGEALADAAKALIEAKPKNQPKETETT